MADSAPTPEKIEPSPPPEIVDSHCHLDTPEIFAELPDVIARAHAAGVMRMVTICTDLARVARSRQIAEENEGVFFAAGTHPEYAAGAPLATVDQFVDLARHPKFVGIGETGLDYHYAADQAEAQKTALRVHIEAAQETGLPLIIHTREADEDTARILTEGMKVRPFSCVMHCFSSGPALARTSLELGFYLSMSGIATFRNAADIREIFAAAPIDRILTETDSPFLAPVPKRGKRNEPAFTAFTARMGAEVFGLDYADFARATRRNFDRLFAKAAAYGRDAA